MGVILWASCRPELSVVLSDKRPFEYETLLLMTFHALA